MSGESISDEFRQNLSKIGVGRRYHNRQLHEFGETGEALRSWVGGNDFRPDIFAGMGRSLYGGPAAHDLFMVLARATYLCGIRSRVISLSVLVHECEGRDIAEELESTPALFITPFYQKDYKGLPLTDFQKLAVEDFINERLDNAHAVFTLATEPLAEARLWWSDMLIQRLQGVNLEVSA